MAFSILWIYIVIWSADFVNYQHRLAIGSTDELVSRGDIADVCNGLKLYEKSFDNNEDAKIGACFNQRPVEWTK